MYIAFWSKFSGRNATSTNMLAISLVSSMICSSNTIVMKSQHLDEELTNSMPRSNIFIKEDFAYYARKGIDALVDRAKLDYLSKEVVYENLISLNKDRLFYLPTSSRKSKEIYEYELANNLSKILKVFEELEEIVLVDSLYGYNSISKMILEEARVVVVNISQNTNQNLIEDLSKEIWSENAVFLVGRYDDKSKDDIANIASRYNIKKDSIIGIPYNIEFADAVFNNKSLEFIKKSQKEKKNSENYKFVMSVYRAAEMILKRAGYSIDVKKGEI